MSRTIEEIMVGEQASQVKIITEQDVELFGKVTNDYNPMHFDEMYAEKSIFKKRIVHGMLVGSLFSKIFGMDLPGEGAIYVGQSLRFLRPVYFKDEITASVVVKEKDIKRNRLYFDCVAKNQMGEIVVTGEAELMPIRKG